MTHTRPILLLMILVITALFALTISARANNPDEVATTPQPPARTTLDLTISLPVTTTRQALVYPGPGEPYPLLVTYAAGLTFPALGRSENGDWFIIAISPYSTGWVAGMDVNGGEETASIPVLTPNPLAVPTLTPTVGGGWKISVSLFGKEAGKTPGVTIKVFGLQKGTSYTTELTDSKGKVRKQLRKVYSEGPLYITYTPGELSPGSYTFVITAPTGESAQTTFTLQKVK